MITFAQCVFEKTTKQQKKLSLANVKIVAEGSTNYLNDYLPNDRSLDAMLDQPLVDHPSVNYRLLTVIRSFFFCRFFLFFPRFFRFVPRDNSLSRSFNDTSTNESKRLSARNDVTQ